MPVHQDGVERRAPPPRRKQKRVNTPKIGHSRAQAPFFSSNFAVFDGFFSLHLKVLAAVSKPKLMGTYSFLRSPSIVLGQPFTCSPHNTREAIPPTTPHPFRSVPTVLETQYLDSVRDNVCSRKMIKAAERESNSRDSDGLTQDYARAGTTNCCCSRT